MMRNILLIDDDEDDQEIFMSALKRLDTKVLCIAERDASKALQKLLDGEIVTDVIFLDLNMPVMSGQQFLVAIKKEQFLSDIPVVIFSTSSHAPTIKLTKELGAKDFITKPDKFDDLIRVLQSFLS